MRHWLVKSEPFKYSWDQFVKDKITFWDGVRNYGARNNMKAMKKGAAMVALGTPLVAVRRTGAPRAPPAAAAASASGKLPPKATYTTGVDTSNVLMAINAAVSYRLAP